MNQLENRQLEELIDKRAKKVVQDFLYGKGFTARKITDTPLEGLAIVNRNYVNMHGSVAAAPKSSILGQQYFASDLGYPIYKNANYRWVNSVGSVVG